MMLVQKPAFPLQPHMSPFHHHHRRNPSAPPAVVVQPTRTPGLLSLSKPLQTQQPQQQHHQRPQRRTIQPATPPPASRGRQRDGKEMKEGKDNKSKPRSTSRKQPHRQSSPPQSQPQPQPQSQTHTQISHPSQAEAQHDPFLVSPPTGKLAARRRQKPQHQPSSKPIPVPQQQHQQQPQLPAKNPHPRSVPVPRPQASSRPAPARANTLFSPKSAFPICDDMTDAGDLSDHDLSPPPTPTRPRPRRRPANPFGPHRRAPSESTTTAQPTETGVFNMSSDEGSGEDSTPSAELQKLFSGLVRNQGQQGKNKFAGSPAFAANNVTSSPPTKKTRGHGASASLSYASPAPKQATLSYSSSLGAYEDYTHSHTPASAPFSSSTFAASFPRASAPRTPPRMTEAQYEAQAYALLHGQDGSGQQGYFASSMFQNSPSPDELPDPLLI